MLVYQRSSPGVRFNQAHNHYLQLASEGGLLLCVPALLVLVSYGVAAARRIARDASSMYWVRAGALCGLAGVARAERVGDRPDRPGQCRARRDLARPSSCTRPDSPDRPSR